MREGPSLSGHLTRYYQVGPRNESGYKGPMGRTGAIILFVLAGLGGVIVLMASVPLDQVQSNLATYATGVHLDGLAAMMPAGIDRWAIFFGLALFISAGLLLEYFRVRPFRSATAQAGISLKEIRAQSAAKKEEQARPSPARAKFYSRAQKERLADLYGELTQFLLINGANGGGNGAWFALANLSNGWNAERGHWAETALSNDKMQHLLKEANDSLGHVYATFYGPEGFSRRTEYLAFDQEIAAVLQDPSHEKILITQTRMNEFRDAVLMALEAQKTDNRRLLEMAINSTVGATDAYNQAIAVFQKWLFEANGRAVAALNALE